MSFLYSGVIPTSVAIILTVVYVYAKYMFSYWKRRGVPYLKPSIPFGNFDQLFMQKKNIGDLTKELYRKTKEPFIGVYSMLRPMLIVRDPDLIRSIFIKDFQHFHDRGVFHDEKFDPLSAHLFAIDGQKWKNLRVKLSPTFTSGKMKAMFSTLVDCGGSLQKEINRIANSPSTKVFEVRELSAQFTTNCIASVAFGIDINCIEDPDTPFRQYGRKVFELSFKNGFRQMLSFIFPAFLRFFKIRVTNQDVEDFMMAVVDQTLKYRENSKVVRKDFFQLLVQLRNTGNVQLDDQWSTVISDENSKKLSFNELAAQAYVFWLAGFETSSTTMTFCMYEIAKNAKIQKKVHEEIDRVLREHDGQISYESLSDMKYLECCMDEALRMYPPVPILNRECTKEYKIPGTEVIIEKGTAVIIPAMALQTDEKYYPEPMTFQPERFLDEKNKSFSFKPYMPFGEGPRVCIGTRMGKLQTKVGLVTMLQYHNYALAPELIGKTLEMHPAGFVPTARNGIKLVATPR